MMTIQHLRRWILLLTLLLSALAACAPTAGRDGARLTLLYTSDEHGWMAEGEDRGGAASMLAHWQADEGYTPDGPFLVLSGGDTWTGPALSTWFQGEPMIEVMNLMGYAAAAIGNHEFDFDLDGLREREAQAEFPFLGANIRDASGNLADFALPYVIQEVEVAGQPVQVGIIGLASTLTPRVTMPTYVAGLTFADYPAVLAEVVPLVKDEGADVIVVTSHLCPAELQALAPAARTLGIAMIGGGHCHRQLAEVRDDVALVEAGWQMEAYVRVDLVLDPVNHEVTDVEVALKANTPTEGDPVVAGVVEAWQAELDDALLVTIGYTEKGIKRGSHEMHNLMMDAWLAGYPADVALCNPGSFRQDIEPGEITLAEIVGLWPFENTLVDVTLTGEQLLATYQHGARRPAVAGLERSGTRFLVNGEPLDPEATYRVLVNDYMYAGGDGYKLATYDPDGYMTGIDWRQPVIDYLVGLDTSPADPLDAHLDPGAR